MMHAEKGNSHTKVRPEVGIAIKFLCAFILKNYPSKNPRSTTGDPLGFMTQNRINMINTTVKIRDSMQSTYKSIVAILCRVASISLSSGVVYTHRI